MKIHFLNRPTIGEHTNPYNVRDISDITKYTSTHMFLSADNFQEEIDRKEAEGFSKLYLYEYQFKEDIRPPLSDEEGPVTVRRLWVRYRFEK